MPANQITGPRACRNFFPSTKKDQIAGRALFKGSGIFNPISAIFRTPTPALAPILSFALGPPDKYTNEDLWRVTKLALKLFV